MLSKEKQLMLDLLIEKYGAKDQQNVEVWQNLSNPNKSVSEPVEKLVEPKKTRKRIRSVNRKHWSTDDMQWLVELSGKYSPDQIALLMKRTKPAIYRMQGNLKWGKCSSRLVHQFRAGKDLSTLGNIDYPV